MDVFRAVLRLVSVTWLTFAGALVGGVGCDRHVAELGQALRVKACNLFLHAAVGMCDDDSGIVLLGIEVCGRIHVGGNLEAVELIRDRMDVDVSDLVSRDGSLIHQTEWVLVGGGCRHGSADAGGCSGGDDGCGFRHFLSFKSYEITLCGVFQARSLKCPVRVFLHARRRFF